MREGRRSRLACLIRTQAPCDSESRNQIPETWGGSAPPVSGTGRGSVQVWGLRPTFLDPDQAASGWSAAVKLNRRRNGRPSGYPHACRASGGPGGPSDPPALPLHEVVSGLIVAGPRAYG
jgi:hypothetical protein